MAGVVDGADETSPPPIFPAANLCEAPRLIDDDLKEDDSELFSSLRYKIEYTFGPKRMIVVVNVSRAKLTVEISNCAAGSRSNRKIMGNTSAHTRKIIVIAVVENISRSISGTWQGLHFAYYFKYS
jgi:hypothetical protein